jgi:hypothetical protein
MEIHKHEPQCITHTRHNKTTQTPKTSPLHSQVERQSRQQISKHYIHPTKRHNTATERIKYPEFH